VITRPRKEALRRIDHINDTGHLLSNLGLIGFESRQFGHSGPKLWRMDRSRIPISDDLPDGRFALHSPETGLAAR
jgi:hypothetical protein